jgi:GGDEF domain-containing protein
LKEEWAVEKYEKGNPLVNVLHDAAWHAVMPGPIFYGQYHDEGATIHGGNPSFEHFLKCRKKHPSYPCDGEELFRHQGSDTGDSSCSLLPLLQREPGWTGGVWFPFGGDEMMGYSLFEDPHGWFVFFLESRRSSHILQGQEDLREKLEELARLYSIREILDPLVATLRESLGFDWTGILSWNSGEGRWSLTAYNGGEAGGEQNARAEALLKALYWDEEPSGVSLGGLEIRDHLCWWAEASGEDSPWGKVLQEQEMASFLAGTLVSGAQPMLFLGFSGKGNRITSIKKEILQGVWPMVFSTVERYRLIAGMETLSDKDAVTGLLRGNSFLQKVTVELSRNRRYSYRISLLYLHIQNAQELQQVGGVGAVQDGFRLLAREALESIRVVDMIGRLDDGGILVLLPHTPLEGAQVVVGRMKERFRGVSPLPSVPMEVTLRSLSYAEGLIPDTDMVLREIQKG